MQKPISRLACATTITGSLFATLSSGRARSRGRRPLVSSATRAFLFSVSALLLPLSAQAVDGVHEINHTCAVDTGCFLGDAAGYPVTITRSGSYRLTGNLSREFAVGDVNDNRIEITANQVHLDLNGFGIVCAEVLFPGEDFCSGVADGIHSDSEAVTIENGTVKGWGGDGISLSENSVVRNVIVRLNQRWGIIAGRSTIVEGVSAFENRFDGINVGVESQVHRSTARENGQDGIDLSHGALLNESTSYDNGSDGIEASPGARISRCTTRSNTEFGLNLATDAAYDHCTVSDLGGVNGGTDRGGNLIVP